MAQPNEAQIQAAWEVDGKPRGIPYPTYKQQYIAQMTGAASGTGRGGGMDDSGVTSSGGSSFLADLAHMTSGDINTKTVASGGDGSLQYYKDQSAAIDEALASPGVSDARKRELRATQAELDDTYYQPREADAKTSIQNAGSDEDALKALQALEGLRSSSGGSTAVRPVNMGTSNSGSLGPVDPGRLDPALDNGLASYNPTDEATIRAAWEAGPKWQGVPYEEYKKQVAAANPTGARRYTSTTARDPDGTPKTFTGIPDPGTSPQAQASAASGARNAELQRDGSLAYFDNITGRANKEYDDATKAANAKDAATLAKLQGSAAATKAKTSGYSDDLFKAANGANDESRAAQTRYTGAVDSYKSANNDALAGYVSGIQPYQHEIAGTTRQNVAFDPEGLAAQRAALAQAQGIAGGSLDYQSQAARAYADPADITRTLEGLDMLRTNATSGGNNQRDNLDIARKEFAEGGKNQEHIYQLALDQLAHGGDKQREVYDRYKEISHPEMTADERNILAQSQRQYATLDKANRDAVGKDLEARGVMSGAAQIAGQQAAQQRLGEERVAGTLGAQAQSVQRAFAALQGMQGTADSLRTGDQNSLSIAGKAATDLRTGNQNAEALMQSAANALRAGDLAAAQAFTAAAQRQREQGFNEEYSRGVAADNASANNQSTRLGGAQLQSSQANAIRSANDQINMFNNEQQGITDRYNTSFKQSEYDRLAGLQQDTFNNRGTINNNNLNAESALNGATESAISGRFGRTNTATQTGIGTAMGNWGIDQGVAGTELDTTGRVVDRADRSTSRRVDTAGNRIELGRQTDQDVQNAIDRLNGSRYGF